MAKKSKYNHKKQTRPKFKKKTTRLEKIAKVSVVCLLLLVMIVPMAVAAITERPIEQPATNSNDSLYNQLKSMGLTDEQIASAMGEATPASADIDTYADTASENVDITLPNNADMEPLVDAEDPTNEGATDMETEPETYNPGFYVGAKVKVPDNVKIGDKIELDMGYEGYDTLHYEDGDYNVPSETMPIDETIEEQLEE